MDWDAFGSKLVDCSKTRLHTQVARKVKDLHTEAEVIAAAESIEEKWKDQKRQREFDQVAKRKAKEEARLNKEAETTSDNNKRSQKSYSGAKRFRKDQKGKLVIKKSIY